jgi:hypothetical protein
MDLRERLERLREPDSLADLRTRSIIAEPSFFFRRAGEDSVLGTSDRHCYGYGIAAAGAAAVQQD